MSDRYKFDAKRPEVWLQDVTDYLAGRTPDLDQLWQWIESQADELRIVDVKARYGGMIDCATV